MKYYLTKEPHDGTLHIHHSAKLVRVSIFSEKAITTAPGTNKEIEVYGEVRYRGSIPRSDAKAFGLVPELPNVDWKQDLVTDLFIENHVDQLRNPADMTPGELCTAITYVDHDMDYSTDIYLRTLCEKADMALEFVRVYSCHKTHEENLCDVMQVARVAAKMLGVTLI